MADASAVVAALLHHGQARDILSSTSIHGPHLLDLEVAAVLRRLCLGRQLDPGQGERLLGLFAQLGIRRWGCTPLLGRIWELRSNLTAYDAAYVALAEALSCTLLTADQKLARASGPTCVIQLLSGQGSESQG